jgi:hypothetical protein
VLRNNNFQPERLKSEQNLEGFQLVLNLATSGAFLEEVWRLGTPISQAFTFEANLREHNDSCKDLESGAMFTNIRVFESPPKQG